MKAKIMEKFTHGIMAITPNKPNEDKSIPVIHFVGYWEEPNEQDVLGLYDELSTDEEFGLTEIIGDIELVPATQDVIDYFNTVTQENYEKNN